LRRIMAMAAVFVALGGCALGRPAADATGEEIYDQLCARCHGANLEGVIGPALGPGSEVAEEADDFIEFTIIHGRGRMPSFSSTLGGAQIDRLVVYIRGVQRG
jgi:mono/diheme cytochrome c family protein